MKNENKTGRLVLLGTCERSTNEPFFEAFLVDDTLFSFLLTEQCIQTLSFTSITNLQPLKRKQK
jgi:hypothetical protein